jgi:HD-GYP domain-containing protein (c-di-GMP phosphodiesterase class II)
MFDISHEVIGVIQLINCKIGTEPLRTTEDFRDRVVPFDDTAVEYGEIVAHQAGIALENAFLTEEKEALFRGFVDASVKAIEQRDPTTSGHSHRVARLCLKVADCINIVSSGPFKNLQFNENQMKEIEYASLLHDFGKLGVREQVLLKSKKLYPWEMDLLLERFELIKARYEIDFLGELVNYLQNPQMAMAGLSPDGFKDKHQSNIQQLDGFLEFILNSNEPTVLEQGGFEKLKDIANLNFCDSKCKTRPYILPQELKALSVSRGSLTAEEFSEIQSHVTHTYEFLRKIPWGRNLANIPQIAAKHHEKLDGSGYPSAAGAEEIPTQSRIMAIADIFDALTAADRPYKKAVPVDKALHIIEMEVKAGKCDAELFKLFIESESYKVVL